MRPGTQRLSLTPEQKNTLKTIERASFLRLCRTLACQPEDRQAILLGEMQRKVRELLANYAANTDDRRDHTAGPFRTILSATDYWDVLHLVTEADREVIVSEISEAASELPINYDYLIALARHLGLASPSRESKQSMRDFLLSIPHVSLFDMEFNAFVTRESVIGGVPFVCVYEQLLSATSVIADVLIPAVVSYRPDSSADPVDESTAARHAKDVDFMNACRSCFRMLFCESDEVVLDASGQAQRLSTASPEGFMRNKIIVAGAQNFVWYHEYAHLLLGHLDCEPCHRVEFEADTFATMMTLLSREDGPNARYWTCVGAVLLFVLFVALDAKRGNRGSSSHPPANERLGRFLRIPSLTLRVMANRFATACNPTFDRWWNFTIDVDR